MSQPESLAHLKAQKKLGVLLIVVSGILYGSLGICGTWLLQDGFSVSAMLFWRFGAAALTLPFLGVKQLAELRKGMSLLEVRDAMINAVLYSASSGLYFLASAHIGTGLGMVIFYSYPVFIFLWIWLFMKQAISGLSWFSLFLVCGGLVCLNQDLEPGRAGTLGIFLAVASCLAYAGYILLSKRQARKVNPVLTTFILCSVSAVYFLLMLLSEGPFLWPHTLRSWAVVLALGFLATALPIFLMLRGLQYVSADQAAILSVFEPVVTVILGAVFLSEKVTGLQSLGICVVLLGAIASSIGLRPKKNLSTSGI